ncbi:MAG: Hsp20/alpha crystallin family protein [Halobacteriota archaeon]
MTSNVPLTRPVKRIGDAVVDTVGQVASRFHEATPLRSDLLENPEAYLVLFDAPGATITDIQVWYETGGIEVRVDRFRTFHEGYEMRFPGRGLALEGRAELPDDAVVDLERTRATLKEDGTLQVRLPKADEDDVDDSDA